MLKVESAEQWAELKQTRGRGLVVHFEADWCEPCVDLNKFLESQTSAFSDVTFARVDAGQLGDVAEAEEVSSVPHIVMYRPEGAAQHLERVAEISGAKLQPIEANLNTIYGNKERRENHASMEDFLKYQINKNRVVVFLTGTPSRPRCGFAGRLIEMLDSYDLAYSYYDVMADDEACQALKKFSDWPTYPQVYVNGELIGGMDICKEMHEKDELAAALGCSKRA
jgi:Grx4 family monothiol glutaredoxin